MRLNIRRKLLLLAVTLAVLPLLVAGRSMIQIMQDELKSSANDALVNTAREVAEEINDNYENTWLGPLQLLRSAIEDERLGVEEKVSLLKSGVRDIHDIAALQLAVEGVDNPLMATTNRFAEALGVGPDELGSALQVPNERSAQWFDHGAISATDLNRFDGSQQWLMSLVLPVRGGLAGRRAVLSARIALQRLQQFLGEHPFNRSGQITVVDADGHKILGDGDADLREFEIIRAATKVLSTPSRTVAVAPYRRPSGEQMLGAFAFPEQLPWVVVVEQDERDAYQAVDKMVSTLALWVLLGLGIAVAGAALFALRLSRPIVEMERVVEAVSAGDLGVRVEGVRSRDEIGQLAQRINEMIRGLTERFNLQKFVSGQTLSAVRGSDESGVKLGGERREVTVLFSDIRGFTAFSERVEPEVVIDMLNTFLRHQAYIVKQYHGDIDKFVGDELVAVFQGEDMVANAARCALAIQAKIAELNVSLPEWPIRIGIGINTGEVVMGAMGSEERMDYTILGDPVNLGARLCSKAAAGETLLSAVSYRRIEHCVDLTAVELAPMQVKGKVEPVSVYALVAEA